MPAPFATSGTPIDALVLIADPYLAASWAVLDALPEAWGGTVLVLQPGAAPRPAPRGLQRRGSRPVRWVDGPGTLEAGGTYICSGHALTEIWPDGRCAVTPIGAGHVACARPVDHLLATLAVCCGARAAAVLLSSAGQDGALGARVLQGAGGTVLVSTDEPPSALTSHLLAEQVVTALPLNAVCRLITALTSAPSGEGRPASARPADLLDRMEDAHCVLDVTFTVVRVNAAAERLLGRPRAELIGQSHWDALPASLDAQVGRALQRAAAGTEQHLTHPGTGEGDTLLLDAYRTAGGGVALFWQEVSGQAQAALHQSEQKYRALFNGMDEAFAVVEVTADAAGEWTDFVFLEVNAAFQRHTGLPDPVGRTATDLLGTPNPRWAALYGRAIDTGEAVRVEETEATLGRTFSLNIFPLGARATRQVAVLFTDVTERNRAAAHLRESEERQMFLLALSDRLRSRTDPGNQQVAATELTLEQFGADHCLFCEVRGEQAVIQVEARRADVPSVIGTYALMSIPGLQETLEAGQPVVVGDLGAAPWLDEDFRTWCRSVRIASFLVIPEIHAGRVVGLFGVTQRAPRPWTKAEVTLAAEVAERTKAAAERACARQALEASEQRLQALIEQLPGGAVFVVDQNLRYLLAQGEALTAAGFTPEQLVGRTVAQILPPEQAGETEARYRMALAGQGFEHEHAARGRAFLTRGVPLRDASGRITAALALSYDITDRKGAEEAVRLLNATLEERIEDRTRRLADLNSELRALVTRTARNLEAPVQALSRMLEPELGDAPQPEVTPWAPAALQDELLKLRGVTQDLQALARLEERDLTRELLPLAELFRDMQAALATRGVRWSTSRLPIVRADRALIRQALSVLQTFLLSPARGVRAVDVGSQEVQGEVWVTVDDNGVGLSGEEAATLFDLTVRSEQEVPLLEGSGLTQVRRIMARHGGWAWAEARGRGGRVVLAFPKDVEVTALEAWLGSEPPSP